MGSGPLLSRRTLGQLNPACGIAAIRGQSDPARVEDQSVVIGKR